MYLNSMSVEAFSEAVKTSYNTAVLILVFLKELEDDGYDLSSLSKAYLERIMGLKIKIPKEDLLLAYEEHNQSHKRELARNRKRRERKCHADVTLEVTQKSRKESRTDVTEKEESGSPLNGPSPPVTPLTPIIPSPREEKAPAKGRKARKAFTKPTVDEVRAYCLERKNGIDPQSFLDHYDSNGWMVGRTPMQDWKAAVRTWERRRATPSTPSQPPAQRWESRVNHFDD